MHSLGPDQGTLACESEISDASFDDCAQWWLNLTHWFRYGDALAGAIAAHAARPDDRDFHGVAECAGSRAQGKPAPGGDGLFEEFMAPGRRPRGQSRQRRPKLADQSRYSL